MRYREHVGPGEDFDAGYRNREAVEEWKKLDPLEGDLVDIEDALKEIRNEIDAAVKFAMESDAPGIEELLTDVL